MNYKVIARAVLEFDIKANSGGKRSLGNSSEYGLILKYMVRKKGVQLKVYANALGITPQALNHILNHKQKDFFSDKELERLGKPLGVSVEELRELATKVREMRGA